MIIKMYGVRGSFPVPGEDTVRYGGNTTCVTLYNIVKTIEGDKIDRLIIDAGHGMIRLGRDIVSSYKAGKESLNMTLLFTHLHPDHIQGFPFFAPNYFRECRIDMYGMQTLKKNVGKILEMSMVPPTFPIEYKDLKSARHHHVLRDGSILESRLKTMRVKVMQAYAPSHPQQGALYFLITDVKSGRKAACIWDNESKTGGDQAVINFAQGAEVMIHDTQYTADEYQSDKFIVQGFGHSTYAMAVEDARQARIKNKLVCTHFNPHHTDRKLDEVQASLRGRGEAFDIILAKEGMEIEV